MPTKPKISLLNLKVNPLTVAEVLEATDQAIHAKKSLRIVQLNPEMTVAAQRNKQIASNITRADLVLANGSGIMWAVEFLASSKQGFWRWISSLAQMTVNPRSVQGIIPEKFTSTTFTQKLLQQANRNESKVLIAGKPKNGHIRHTEAYLTKKYPQAKFTSFDGSNFDPQKQLELERLAKEFAPDVCLLGLGFPAQENAGEELKKTLKRSVIVGEGGTFDYENFGGTIKRAPQLLQSLHLEWLWRLIREPSRWRRQLAIPRFAWMVYRATKRQ